jgi:hypothetical protein
LLCPSCGAPTSAGLTQCAVCGKSLPAPRAGARRSGAGKGLLLAISGLLSLGALIGTAVHLHFLLSDRWDYFVQELPGAPNEDFIGVYRRGDDWKLARYDGGSFERRWAVDLPRRSWKASDFVVAGTRIVVSQRLPGVLVIDTTTGAAIGPFMLAAARKDACAARDGRALVWFYDDWSGAGETLDLMSGARTVENRPAWCDRCDDPTAFACYRDVANGVDLVVPLGLAFLPTHVDYVGKQALAVGPNPGGVGTALAGFERQTKTVRWSGVLAPDASGEQGPWQLPTHQMRFGHWIGAYLAKDGTWHIAEVDVDSGRHAWDLSLPKRAKLAGVASSATRVYLTLQVGSSDWMLWVVDVKSGQVLEKLD